MDNNNFNIMPEKEDEQGVQQGEIHYGSYTHKSSEPIYRPPQAYLPAQQQIYQPTQNAPRKRCFGPGSVLALMLCAAIVSAMVSGAITEAALQGVSSVPTSSTSTPVGQTSVTITDNSTNLIEAVAEAVTPSVVGIQVVTNSVGFGSQSGTSEGSGVIYSTDGYIITNHHVISTAINYKSDIKVYLPSDPENGISATLVGYDASTDLAVLKINKTGLPAIKIGDSDKLKTGQIAVVVGNPGGLSFLGSISAGYISGLNRTLQIDSYTMTLIQTDAAINPGNSGGALVDSEGKLIGVPNVKISDEDFEGMGFAIPVNTVVEVCNGLITNQSKPKPYIGVEIDTRYTAELLSYMGYPAGAVVGDVTSGGPAESAGIKSGDIITAINGSKVDGYEKLSALIAKCEAGDTVTVTIYRSRQYKEFKVTVGTTGN